MGIDEELLESEGGYKESGERGRGKRRWWWLEDKERAGDAGACEANTSQPGREHWAGIFTTAGSMDLALEWLDAT